MISKKIIAFIAMTIMMISLLIGCSNNTMDKVYNDNSKIASVYDTLD